MTTYRNRLLALAIVAVTAVAVATMTQSAGAQDNRSSVREQLSGYAEVPFALSTTGSGLFRAQIDDAAQEITYTLSYADLEAAVTQAHIHFGSVSQAGGISVFLCTNLGNSPVPTQACPAAPATVTGTLRPADVIGPVAQGITAGQFDELVAAIRAGTAYVNVHSSLYPGGEIRAQLGHLH